MSEIRKFTSDRNTQVLLANVLWVVLAAAAVTIFVLGTIGLVNGLREPCVVFQNQAREFCLERQDSLAALGIGALSYALFSTVSMVVKVLPWILVGVLIYARKSNELVGIFFSLGLILVGTIAIDASLAAWAVFYYPWLAPLVTILEFAGLALVALLYAFPDGQFVPRWTRWLALVWVLGALGSVLLRGTLFDLGALSVRWNILPALFIASFIYSLGYRYFQTANALQKRQIQWVAAGAAIYGVVYLLRLIPALQAGATVTSLQLGYVVLLAMSSCVFAVCLGISVLNPWWFGRKRTAEEKATADSGPQTAGAKVATESRPQTTGEKATTDSRPQTAEVKATAGQTKARQTKKGKRRKK